MTRLWWLLFLLLPLPGASACDGCVAADSAPDLLLVRGSVMVEQADLDVTVVEAVQEVTFALKVRGIGNGSQAELQVPLPPSGILTGLELASGSQSYTAHLRNRSGLGPSVPSGVSMTYAEGRVLQVSFPVAYGEAWTMAATYVAEVPLAHGHRVVRIPLTGLGSPAAPLQRIEATVSITSTVGLEDLQATGLPLGVVEATDRHVLARATVVEPGPLKALTVAWSPAGTRNLGAVCASDPRAPFVEGLFVVEVRDLPARPRDVVFLVDASAAMAGKMPALSAALLATLQGMGSDDRFQVVGFAGTVTSPQGSWSEPGGPAGDAATVQAWLAGLQPSGQGNVAAALAEANRRMGGYLEPRDAHIILVTADATLPADPAAVVDGFVAADVRDARVHVVGVDASVRGTYLHALALRTGGHVQEAWSDGGRLGERLQGTMSHLQGPLAEDVRLSLGGLTHAQSLQGREPVLYADASVLASFGNIWPRDGKAVLVLEGQGRDGAVEARWELAVDDCTVFPPAATLSARWHVDELLAASALNGTRAMDPEAGRLALAHGLASPSTTWVLEPTDLPGQHLTAAVLPSRPQVPETAPLGDVKESPAVTVGLVVLLALAIVRSRRAR